MFFAADIDPDADVTVECGVDNTEPSVQVYAPSMPALPSLELYGGKHSQKFIIEVWIEKSTQNDWLVPLCRRRGVNLMVGIGEQSEIRSRQLALRAARYGVPVRIIYIADFDPGGRSMPKAVARKVEFTIAKLDLDVDLQLIPLALTADQCREYRLPRPIKETERRKATFESTFGEGATELDALEALHPGELARLLNAEIDNWLDLCLDARSESVHRSLLNDLGIIEEEVRSRYEVQIALLRSAFDDIVARSTTSMPS